MPAKKTAGYDRINLRCEPWLSDGATEAARSLGLDLSSFIRLSMITMMKSMGLPVKGSAAKPRGRPRKEGGK